MKITAITALCVICLGSISARALPMLQTAGTGVIEINQKIAEESFYQNGKIYNYRNTEETPSAVDKKKLYCSAHTHWQGSQLIGVGTHKIVSTNFRITKDHDGSPHRSRNEFRVWMSFGNYWLNCVKRGDDLDSDEINATLGKYANIKFEFLKAPTKVLNLSNEENLHITPHHTFPIPTSSCYATLANGALLSEEEKNNLDPRVPAVTVCNFDKNYKLGPYFGGGAYLSQYDFQRPQTNQRSVTILSFGTHTLYFAYENNGVGERSLSDLKATVGDQFYLFSY